MSLDSQSSHSTPIHNLNDHYVMPHGCKQLSICHMSVSRTNIQIVLDNNNKPTNGKSCLCSYQFPRYTLMVFDE
jgi:hypothetical protein